MSLRWSSTAGGRQRSRAKCWISRRAPTPRRASGRAEHMAIGRIAQIIGAVVDVEFPPDELPEIFNALEVERPGQDHPIVLEAQQHIGNNWVRCISMSPTDGLKRGIPVKETGATTAV